MPSHLSSTRTRFYPRPHLASIFPLQETWSIALDPDHFDPRSLTLSFRTSKTHQDLLQPSIHTPLRSALQQPTGWWL